MQEGVTGMDLYKNFTSYTLSYTIDITHRIFPRHALDDLCGWGVADVHYTHTNALNAHKCITLIQMHYTHTKSSSGR